MKCIRKLGLGGGGGEGTILQEDQWFHENPYKAQMADVSHIALATC